ncbi:MAG: sulfite exporter TauE/SafE family protein [Chloroflexota bacterium]|nr:sulfite exporter TauE/SafE family protein [Chloroflexota bacterium]
MRRLVIGWALALLALPLGTVAASAHPLGNFTVNHFSRVTVLAGAIQVRYVLDLAEIPTLQETQAAQVEGIAQRLADEVSLSVDGVAAHLALRSSSVERLEGQAGLATLRVTLELEAPAAGDGARVAYRDGTYAGRIGWHAVVFNGAVRDATAGADDPTNELRSYPSDPSLTPPDVTDAAATVDLSVSVARTTAGLAALSRFAIDTNADMLASYLRGGSADLGTLAAALLVAMALGALHALGPGHGKAMVAAYLVGSRGTPGQAVVLGTTVTITHTVGVYALGALTLVAAQYLLPERLYPILGVLSGVLVIAIGLGLLRARIRSLRGHADHRDELEHGHSHGNGPSQHRHDGPVGMRGLVALGVSGGLLPCPTALVVLLAAVSVHNVLLGMVLVASFSVGLAIVLTGIGLAFVFGQRALRRRQLLSRVGGSAIARALPTLSAAAITVAGVIIAVGAARGLA